LASRTEKCSGREKSEVDQFDEASEDEENVEQKLAVPVPNQAEIRARLEQHA